MERRCKKGWDKTGMNTEHKDILLTEARLSSPPAEQLMRHYQRPGLAREQRQFKDFVAVDLAHTVMLVEEGILARDQGAAILKTLLEIRELSVEDFPVDAQKGSFLLQVEAYLSQRIGEDIAGRMHTGRSRIDQGATVRRRFKRDRLLDVMERLIRLEVALIGQAKRHARTIMPGYTHMQHAQPWVFGHYLLSFCTKFREDFQRMVECYARVNLNPLGTVGLSGTSWPLNRQRTTELLGFSGLVENSKLGREAYYAAEAIAALSYAMCDLNDLATDLHVWSTTEFGLVETDDAYCGTSSIFPQKKNPSALETIKRAGGGAVTWLATALATFRAEGTGDQAMRTLPAIDDAFNTTEGMLDLGAGVVDTLIVHEDRMRELVSSSWCTASNLADVIVRETGLSFRQTHHVVARLVRICLAEKVLPSRVTAAILNRAAQEIIGSDLHLSESALREALDPDVFVRTRVTTGSVAPSEVDRMLAAEQQGLEQATAWLSAERQRIADSARKLDSAVRQITG
jgi:argininosuccinate lyase